MPYLLSERCLYFFELGLIKQYFSLEATPLETAYSYRLFRLRAWPHSAVARTSCSNCCPLWQSANRRRCYLRPSGLRPERNRGPHSLRGLRFYATSRRRGRSALRRYHHPDRYLREHLPHRSTIPFSLSPLYALCQGPLWIGPVWIPGSQPLRKQSFNLHLWRHVLWRRSGPVRHKASQRPCLRFRISRLARI